MARRAIGELGQRQFDNYLNDLIALDNDPQEVRLQPPNIHNEHQEPVQPAAPMHIDAFIDNYILREDGPDVNAPEQPVAQDDRPNVNGHEQPQPEFFPNVDIDPGENNWVPVGPYDLIDINNVVMDVNAVGDNAHVDIPNNPLNGQYQLNIAQQNNGEDDSEDEDADEIDHNYANQPLYTNAEVTVGESMLINAVLQNKHNLSQVCLQDIMKAIELHCPELELFKNSIYKSNRFFNISTAHNRKHYYCLSCCRELNNGNDICPDCPQSKASYFIRLPFIKHLREMYMRQGFREQLHQRFDRDVAPGHIEDIYDGALYKDLARNGILLNADNISFTWYIDGIPVFISSHVAATPIYLTINELPANERKKRENILLIGIWFGPRKPHTNLFFQKFSGKFNKLALEGIDVNLPDGEAIHVYAVLLAGTCDLPAKCDAMNFTYFNGKYGCPACFEPGVTVRTGIRSTVHAYQYRQEGFELRTRALCMAYAHQALPGNPIRGVKGISVISLLMADFIRGMGIDRMHGIGGGVMKKKADVVVSSVVQKRRMVVVQLHPKS